MVFKKFRGQIFDVDLNAKERQVLNQKVNELLIGATAKQVQDSAADFMRLGYSLKEASELSRTFTSHITRKALSVPLPRIQINETGFFSSL